MQLKSLFSISWPSRIKLAMYHYTDFMNIMMCNYMHCRPRVWNILWFGRKLECVVKLVQFYIFREMPNMFFMLVKDNHQVWFEYTDFQILINSFTTKPGIGKCVFGNFCQKRLVATPR